MTSNAELIAEARRLENDYGDNYEVMTHLSALADALEASVARVNELEAQAKDFRCERVFRISEMQELLEAQQRIAELEAGIEWEYQCTNNINTTGLLDDPEIHAKQCAGRIERRRKAGPWLPVEGEN